MRKSLLAVVCLSLLALVGFQVLSPPSQALTLAATVDIKPETLHVNMKGKWITVFIGLPEGYNVSEIDPSTIRLEGMFQPEWCSIECDRLMAKFEAYSVTGYLADRLYHMGIQRASIELTVIGKLKGGIDFSGSDTITAINPHE